MTVSSPHWFQFFWGFFWLFPDLLKEHAMFPRAQLFEAHTFGHHIAVPAQAAQTLYPLTFPQWQGPRGQTIAVLHSARTPVASGTVPCMLCVMVLAVAQGNPTVSP